MSKPGPAFLCALSAVLVGGLLAGTAQAADGPITAVQRALRAQGENLGEPTGEMDEPTRAALKRYQARIGVTATGDVTLETLQALQNGRNAPAVKAPPATPAPVVRDRPRKVEQSDREFLASAESAAPPSVPAGPTLTVPKPPVATPAPSAPAFAFPKASAVPTAPARIAPPSTPPEPIATIAPTLRPSPTTPAPRAATPTPAVIARAIPVATPPPAASVRTAPLSFARPSAAPPSPTPAAVNAQPSGTISESEARRFVESYLQVAEGPSPDLELAFYGDPIDYFDSGRVSHQFVEYDQRNYYRRWPARDFTLLSLPTVESASGGNAVLRYRVRYALGSGGQKTTGQNENTLNVRRTPDGLKIVGIHERKVAE